MPDNAPRPLRDVLADLYADDCVTPELQYHYANADCERLGLTNAVVVPDLAAHDRAEREARDAELRWPIERALRRMIMDPRSFAKREPNVLRDAAAVTDAILGPAPHTAPQAHERSER